MLVFISWSGERSKEIAEGLKVWLKQTIQITEPWTSEEISKGARWNQEINHKLSESKMGIICLTPENISERSILFEAGALARNVNSPVCTLLMDLKPEDIGWPLGQFQHTKVERNEFRKLLTLINAEVEKSGSKPLDESTLDAVFDRNWSDIERIFISVQKRAPSEKNPPRNAEEILSDILEFTRYTAQSITSLLEDVRDKSWKKEEISSVIREYERYKRRRALGEYMKGDAAILARIANRVALKQKPLFESPESSTKSTE